MSRAARLVVVIPDGVCASISGAGTARARDVTVGDGHSVSAVRVGGGRERERLEPSSLGAMTILSRLHDILESRAPLPPFCINVRLERQVSIDRRRSSRLRLYGERRGEGGGGGQVSGGRRTGVR